MTRLGHMTTIGIVHPGEMGAAIGATLAAQDHTIVWASDQRSAATGARAGRAGLAAIATEVGGLLRLDAPGGPFELTATADRIDRFVGGGLRLVAYKTGAVPSQIEVAAGCAPQLRLAAAIATRCSM